MSGKFLIRFPVDAEREVFLPSDEMLSDEDDLGPLRKLPIEKSSQDVLELGEMLAVVSAAVRSHIESTTMVKLELKGAITTTTEASGGANVYIFNFGAKGQEGVESAVTISVETTIEPFRT